MNQKPRKTKKAKAGNSNKALNDGVVALPHYTTAIAKPIDQVLPDKLVVTLKLISTGRTTVTTGVQATGFRNRATSIFDSTFTGLVPTGYAQLSALYGSYRVSSNTYTLIVNNLSAITAMMVYLAPLNEDPGASPSAATIISYANNTYGQVKLIGALGAPPVTISKTMSTERIFGTKAVYFDDNFSALVNANPNNNWFWGVGFSQDVPSPASPATVSWVQEIWFNVEFFNRLRLNL